MSIIDLTNHSEYMTLALQLAQRGRSTVSPNPMVGCVIVNDNKIVGTGYHQKAGGPHAEIFALQEAGSRAKNSTLYVTLEPCCHYGRTPPCTQALIQAGVKRVYVACTDSNALMSGKGIEELRKAGIAVDVGLHEAEAKKLNEVFFHYIQHKRPFVYAKWAMSFDGKTTTHIDDTRNISSKASQQASHQLRQQVDAILIGANTAIHDNPLLTARLTDHPAVKQPTRIVISSSGDLPLHLNVFDTSLSTTIVATTNKANKDWVREIREKNIDVIILPTNNNAHVHLPSLLDELAKKEISSLLVEGGMTLLHDFFNENLVNKIQVYLAPMIIGSLKQKRRLFNVNTSTINHDFIFTADYEDITCLVE